MFSHENMQVMGLYPGMTTKDQIANLGHRETEIIIEPVISRGGGGYVPAPLHLRPTHYRVTVRIKYNGKWYEDSQIVDEKTARVTASFYGIKTFSTNSVTVAVNGIQIYEKEEITVTVNRIINT